MIRLRLPMPPSVNTYWRHVGDRVLISKQGRRYRTEVRAEVLIARVRPLTGRLAMRITLHPPDRRRRDLDNSLKAALDALQAAGVYEDDSQIDDLHIRRGPQQQPGCAVVEVVEMEDDKRKAGV